MVYFQPFYKEDPIKFVYLHTGGSELGCTLKRKGLPAKKSRYSLGIKFFPISRDLFRQLSKTMFLEIIFLTSVSISPNAIKFHLIYICTFNFNLKFIKMSQRYGTYGAFKHLPKYVNEGRSHEKSVISVRAKLIRLIIYYRQKYVRRIRRCDRH